MREEREVERLRLIERYNERNRILADIDRKRKEMGLIQAAEVNRL